MSFTTPIDIAKRALQHLGQPTIAALSDSSRQAVESNFCYPLLRQAELRKAPWTFAARRAVLRARTTTTYQVVFPTWAIGTTYTYGDIVRDSANYLWFSNSPSNTGNTPGVSPFWEAYCGPIVADTWASGNFFPGDVVRKTTVAYIATPLTGVLVTTQDPASGAPWHVIQAATTAANQSHEPQGYSIAPLALATTASVRNIYDLPANYMRIAPQDVKAAATPRQLLTAGQQFNDFEIEGSLLYSADNGPKIFRFTGDFTEVSLMEPLFCELVALSMARAMCMILTGNRELETIMFQRYQDLADDARTQALIEAGSTELEPKPQPPNPAGQVRGA